MFPQFRNNHSSFMRKMKKKMEKKLLIKKECKGKSMSKSRNN
jgi:hypothetical protein